MQLKPVRIYLLLAVTVLVVACTPGTAGTGAVVNPQQSGKAASGGELKFKVPNGWVTEKPSSSMRIAQYKLPKVEGDSDDATLVLYFFGSGQGGSIADNVDRWVKQIEQPKEKEKIETITVNGLKVTTVDVSGTYTAQMSPGSEARHNESNQRLRAAVIETPKGNYFAKLIGPEKTVSRWDSSFMDYVKSFEFK
jgi:hypothetical protein